MKIWKNLLEPHIPDIHTFSIHLSKVARFSYLFNLLLRIGQIWQCCVCPMVGCWRFSDPRYFQGPKIQSPTFFGHLPQYQLEWEPETIKKVCCEAATAPQDSMIEKTPTPHHRRNGCLPSFCSLFSKQNPLPNSRIFSYLLGSLSDFNLFGLMF